MRGTRLVPAASLIPRRGHPRTCGEHAFRPRLSRIWCTVHPRPCGGYSHHLGERPGFHGSPPHMRGTRFCSRAPRCIRRFTPAHAGNTQPPVAARGIYPVHPRTCGEHKRGITPWYSSPGSPPHMRGTLPSAIVCHGFSRFTPAHAGNTGCFGQPGTAPEVHPRTCGEHSSGKFRISHCLLRGRVSTYKISGSRPTFQLPRDH